MESFHGRLREELDQAQPLLRGQVVAAANSVTLLNRIAHDPAAQRFYLIEWTSPHGPARNHYLAGHPPFDLVKYRRWLQAAELA
ncbi:MAG: hypothetical protein IT578_00155 [Verrucomicrobiae bacterium]|nr:hypothetical protein [Verrucomicrobiae bacterium]